MTNTNITQYREPTRDSMTYGCNHCGQYVGDLIDHRKTFHPDLAQRDNRRALNPEGKGIAGRVLPVLMLGALTLGANGCNSDSPIGINSVVPKRDGSTYVFQDYNSDSTFDYVTVERPGEKPVKYHRNLLSDSLVETLQTDFKNSLKGGQ